MKCDWDVWTPTLKCLGVSVAFTGCCVMTVLTVAWEGQRTADIRYASTPPAVALQIEPYEWHDADTARGTIRQFYALAMEEDRGIRAIGYDAWEIGHRAGAGVTEAERARGRAALAELRELSQGRTLWAEPEKRGSRDSFGRPLARFWLRDDTGWIDVAAWARANGHTRR